MRKKAMVFGMFLGIFLMFGSLGDVYSADEPSKLLVVRGGGNSLWKATCNGDDCSAWTSISGTFTQQPTLVWDSDVQQYYLYGVGEDGQIWSSTFDRFGDHNNDWVALPGSTLSPIAAVGGGIDLNFNWAFKTGGDFLSYGSVTNCISKSIACPLDGYVIARATGTAVFGLPAATINSAVLYLVDTSGGSDDPTNVGLVEYGVTLSFQSFAHQRIFQVSGGTNKTVYLTGKKGYDTATSVSIQKPVLTLEFFPYKMP